MSIMTPREIVHELDKHIVGQEQAKRADCGSKQVAADAARRQDTR